MADEFYADFWDDFPADDPVKAIAWRAFAIAGQVDYFAGMIEREMMDRFPVALYCREINSSLRDLHDRDWREYLIAVVDVHPDTGVVLGKHRARCYAEIAQKVGSQLHASVMAEVDPDRYIQGLSQGFVPIDPAKSNEVFHRIALDEPREFYSDLKIAVETEFIKLGCAGAPRFIPVRPKITLGENPQIILGDHTPIALTFEQAEYLKALCDSGDWMSSSEFRIGSRPDRIRSGLPRDVLKHIETDRRKGSRWKLT